jgi:hypothetical protein
MSTKTIYVFLLTALLGTMTVTAQSVAVNNDASSPDASAILDIKSTDKGILIPRMTQAQMLAIASPQTGLMVYQSDGNKGFYYNAGTTASPVWTKVGETSFPTSSANISVVGTAGTTTFTVPSDVSKVFFEIVGGGAGAGGSFVPVSAGTSFGGGGGGGGGFAKGYLYVTPGEVLTLTVGGSGGPGTNSATTPTAGTAGSTTSISSGATVLISVFGGSSGGAATSTSSGFGGASGTVGPRDLTRSVISSFAFAGILGGTGLAISGSPPFQILTGISGPVINSGNFNTPAFVQQLNSGNGTSLTLMPFYGRGGGYNSPSQRGYIVLYW